MIRRPYLFLQKAFARLSVILSVSLLCQIGTPTGLPKHQEALQAWAESPAGIGAMIRREQGEVVVKQVVPGGPASQAGLQSGDTIRKVEGRFTGDLTMDQVVGLILGPAGTPVRLEIARSGDARKTMEVSIVRAPLQARSSQGYGQRAPTPSPSQGNLSAVSGVLHLKRVPVMDFEGWDRPVPAKTLLIPAEWHTRGGVTWKRTYCSNDLIAENFVASSPDGQLVFETLPGYSWQWANHPTSQTTIRMSGCVLAPPKGAQQVLSEIITRYRRGANVRTVERSAQAARGLYDELYGLFGPYYNAQGIRLSTDALRALIEYRYGGRSYEEWITFGWVQAITPVMGLPPVYTYFIRDIAAFRAPRGQLQGHETLFSTILASTRTNPVWLHALVQLVANVNMNASRAAGNRAAIWSDAMNQIGEMRVRTWQQSQESLSRISVAWSRAFRGVDGYIDPTTHQRVELPTGYRNAWSDGMGGYVLSPDPSFDPNLNKTFKQRNWHRLRLQR